MSRDHYVAQTYLKHFCGEDSLLQRYFKKGKIIKSPTRVSTKSVCYEVDGDSNKLLKDPDLVRDFLTKYENNWDKYLEDVQTGKFNLKIKEDMAVYLMYMKQMSPSGRELAEKILYKIEPISGTSLTKEVSQKELKDTDEGLSNFKAMFKEDVVVKNGADFVHAFIVDSLINQSAHRGYTSSKWQFLINNTKFPFITSDHPVCLFPANMDQDVSPTFVPLTPTIGLKMIPSESSKKRQKKEFDNRSRVYIDPKDKGFKEVKAQQVKSLNTLLIKTAKEYVLSPEHTMNIQRNVEKFKNWSPSVRCHKVGNQLISKYALVNNKLERSYENDV